MSSFETLIERARTYGVLSLCYVGLVSVPSIVPTLLSLRRLDLAHNELTTLPTLAPLTHLAELFLNDNPLESIPGASLASNFALRFLDLRRTKLATLPPSLSRLPLLLDVSLEGTHLEAGLATAARVDGTHGLLAQLKRRDERDALEYELRKKLALDVWREAGDTEAGQRRLDDLVAECSLEFPDNGDFKAVINNAVRLFGADPNVASPHFVRQRFQAIKDDNERKALGAEIELAMRAFYFDAADPKVITHLREGIVAALPTLEDAKFLLQYHRLLLPPTAALVVPLQLPALIQALRTRMHQERESAIAALLKTLGSNLYPEREPGEVEVLARGIASPTLSLSTSELRSLTADASELFPTEFASAHARKIVKAFRELQERKGVTTKKNTRQKH
jgi:Leucine-rich repeat (LRR) protein